MSKKIKHPGDIDYNAIFSIINLKLKKFYEIYDLLFDMNGKFKGYTMKYYEKENITII